jgi:LPXTG-motif cell wall-anchored protein
MKRLTRIVATAGISSVLLLGSASMALAQTTYPVAPNSGSVEGASGSTAFTGSSSVPMAVMMAGALLLVGLAALFVARRRTAHADVV